MATYLVVAEWYVFEKSLIQETICDAERPEQSPWIQRRWVRRHGTSQVLKE